MKPVKNGTIVRIKDNEEIHDHFRGKLAKITKQKIGREFGIFIRIEGYHNREFSCKWKQLKSTNKELDVIIGLVQF